MQTTAMGEVLYLAFFIWAVVYFSEFVRGEEKALTKCGLCLVAACLTRYDGWFLAGAMMVGAVVGPHFYRQRTNRTSMLPISSSRTSRMAIMKFILLAAAAAAPWVADNAAPYCNPPSVSNRPHSA